MNDSGSSSSKRPTNVRWLVFSLGCGTSWMLYLHRYTFGLIKPKLQQEFGWTSQELGVLDSTFSLFYAGLQIPLGILADLFGAHLFLSAILIFWSLALGLLAGTSHMAGMQAARALFGAGQSGCYPALSQLTRNWFPPTVRTSVQGWIAVFFGRLGGASANFLVGTMLLGFLHWSWREAVVFLAAVGVGWGCLFWLLFRNSPRRHYLANEAEAELIEGPAHAQANLAPPVRLTFRSLLSRMKPRSLLNLNALALQAWLSTLADSIYVSWIPLFLYQVHGLNYKEMGIYAMLPLLGGACGGACGGLLNDWLIRFTGNRRWSRSLVGLSGKGGAGLLLIAALLLFEQPFLFCSMLFFVKFLSDWSLPTTWGTVTDIGAKQSASVFAFVNSVASTAEVLAPLLYGFIAQFYGWRWGFVVVACAYGLNALSWLLVDCTIAVLSET